MFDYLAAGRPIVATDIPTHRTVLAEERAVLVAPRTEALAEGILSVLGDPARAGRLGRGGPPLCQSHFGWSRFVGSVEALYAEVERHAGVAEAERRRGLANERLGHHPGPQREPDDRAA